MLMDTYFSEVELLKNFIHFVNHVFSAFHLDLFRRTEWQVKGVLIAVVKLLILDLGRVMLNPLSK